MKNIEYSVARVERDGTIRRHTSLACWPVLDSAHLYMRWMNDDLYRAMQEQAVNDGPGSPFAKWFSEQYEGTQCVVVAREVGEWMPYVEGIDYPSGSVPQCAEGIHDDGSH